MIKSDENKNIQKEDEIYGDQGNVYISDVTFGEAVNYLHDELHKIDLNL